MVDDTIEEIAQHARLNLTEQEKQQFGNELEDVLDAFDSLDKIDTDGVEPAFHPIDLKGKERDDQPEECLSQEEALANTENQEDGYFKGPRST